MTGRPSAVARELVGVEELVYAGEHGLELDPAAAEWAARVHAFAAPADGEASESRCRWPTTTGAPTMPRRAIGAGDVDGRGVAEGFRTRWGRMVLEVLPPVDASKGTAVRHLLAESGLHRALYAGDDTTDLDGFAALDGLEVAVRVAVSRRKGPAELSERADVIVRSTGAFLGFCSALRELERSQNARGVRRQLARTWRRATRQLGLRRRRPSCRLTLVGAGPAGPRRPSRG